MNLSHFVELSHFLGGFMCQPAVRINTHPSCLSILPFTTPIWARKMPFDSGAILPSGPALGIPPLSQPFAAFPLPVKLLLKIETPHRNQQQPLPLICILLWPNHPNAFGPRKYPSGNKSLGLLLIARKSADFLLRCGISPDFISPLISLAHSRLALTALSPVPISRTRWVASIHFLDFHVHSILAQLAQWLLGWGRRVRAIFLHAGFFPFRRHFCTLPAYLTGCWHAFLCRRHPQIIMFFPAFRRSDIIFKILSLSLPINHGE